MPKELTLTCLLWPGDMKEAVDIKFNIELSTYELKEEIVRSTGYSARLADIDVLKLVLYKCSFPVDDDLRSALETVRFDGTDDRLEHMWAGRSLDRYFTEDEVPKDCIHVIFEIPKIESDSTIEKPIDELLRRRKQFNTNISKIPISVQALPSSFAKMQADPEQSIAWSRPYTSDGTIPVTLYHSVFRQFMDDCKSHRPCAEDHALAFELSIRMSEFFKDEDTRAEEFRDIMQRHGIDLSENSVESNGREFLTQGDIQVDGCRIVILGLMNEIGGGGCDPYAQGILSYMHSTWPASERFPQFNFPCLISTLFGAHISFSGTVWNERPHFQILSPALPLFWHLTDKDMRTTLARHVGALKKAIHSLTECYTTVFSGKPSLTDPDPTDLAPRFPDQRTYHSLADPLAPLVHFKYLCQLHDKLLFLAETNNNESAKETLCVKFVRQYSRAAHELCASLCISPRLRGFEAIGGGWTMVVMDVTSGEYTRVHDLEPEITLSPSVYERIREALSTLHHANLVHGDVRNTNILVKGNGEEGVVLIDFDWAGVVGEVRYPMNVYKGEDLWRPDDVEDGELIQPEHDIDMLNRLFADRDAMENMFTWKEQISIQRPAA